MEVEDRQLAGPRPVCPEEEPELGEACPRPGLVCGYGSSAMPNCRKHYQCAETGWVEDPHIPRDRYPCDEAPPGYCPSEPPPRDTACTPVPARAPCVYAEVQCSCVSGSHWATGTDQWLCYGPPNNPQCPETLPNIGEGCSTPGVQCSYIEDCEFPPYSTVFCRLGAWEEGQRGTPCNL